MPKYKVLLLVLGILLLANLQVFSGNIIFRIDDYGIDNEEFYIKLFEIFEKNHAKILVGIVPFKINNDIIIGLTDKQKEILKIGIEKGVVDIAQHGCFHKNNSKCSDVISEFYGLSYNSQLKLINDGKEYLENELNVTIDIFIPPWNTYDTLTLRILDSLKFNVISAALNNNMPTISSRLKYLPFTSDLKSLERRFNEITSEEDKVIVVLFHGTDFQDYKINKLYEDYNYYYPEPNFNIDRLDLLLKKIGINSIKINEIKDLSNFNNETYELSRIPNYSLPIYPIFKIDKSLYYPDKLTRWQKLMIYKIYPFTIYLTILVLSYCLYILLMRYSKKRPFTHLLLIIIIILLNMIIVISVTKFTISLFVILSVSIGIILGATSKYILLKNRHL